MSCSGDDDEGSARSLPDCPVDALDEADGTVEITFWHAMTRTNRDTLTQLTDQFNASQDEVRVRLVYNDGYDVLARQFLESVETGDDVPDVAQLQEIYLQRVVDSDSVLPAGSCIEAAELDTSDFVPQALDYYEVDGVQWALPFNVASLVLLYNRAAFERVGLDPDEPPSTFEELRSVAQAFKDEGYRAGLALKLDAAILEQMLALQGHPFVDQHNGRTGRATEVAFDDEVGVEVLDYLDTLIDEGLALSTPAEEPGGNDNLLAVMAGDAAMTINSSGALGSIVSILESSDQAGVELGAAPLPGRTDDGGALVGGAGLYLSATEPAKQAAAWRYMTFLTSAESQATWSAATGYLPVNEEAIELPALAERWKEVPALRVAFDQMVEGATNNATAGAVIGDYLGVRSAVAEALNRMVHEDVAPSDALSEAARRANATIDAYNDEVTTRSHEAR